MVRKPTMTTVLVFLTASGILLAQSEGRFDPTGSLTSPRTYHTATLLTTGKVLIAGGNDYNVAGSSVWSTAELYDPATGTFQRTANMHSPRFQHTATLLPDSRVLIAGGASLSVGTSTQSSAEVYDPQTGTFSMTGDMLASRERSTATLLNTGKVLITGGSAWDAQGKISYLSSAELFDPLTGTFSATGAMNAGRSGHVAVVLTDGEVLIDGGRSCMDNQNPELYDPTTGQFTLAGASAFTYAAVSGSLLLSGDVLMTVAVGCDVGSGAEVYGSASGSFTPTAKMNGDRNYNTTTLLPEGRVLIDGEDYTSFTDQGASTAELYDPASGTFTAITRTFPRSAEGHTATLLPDGSVLVAGGWMCCGSSLATADLYHPAHPAPSSVLYSLPGGSQGAILHATTHEVVSFGNPAVAGEAVEIYCAGLIDRGAIPPQVAIGGRLAEVVFFGNAPEYAGLNQIDVRVPTGIAPSSAVPVRINYIGRPSNAVTIAIQ